MPHLPRYTQQQVIEALTTAKGLVSIAATRLNCSQQTVMNYMRRYPKVRAVAQNFRDRMTDVAELKFWEAIQRGDPWAIGFQLKTQGRSRGYAEQVDFRLLLIKAVEELTHQGDVTVEEVMAEADEILASRR